MILQAYRRGLGRTREHRGPPARERRGEVTVAANAKTDAIVVPAAAVTLDATNADEGTVMVVDDTLIAHETKVTVGIRTSDKMEIIPACRVARPSSSRATTRLPDGPKVEISKQGDEEKGDGEATRERSSGSQREVSTVATDEDGSKQARNQMF